MQIFTARTCETFDIDYLCEDLRKQIEENVTFGSRTMGIAICDSTIDYQAVMKRLSEMYSFDIYGGTAIAFIRIMVPEDISVSFMIITGNEELVGSMALSAPITAENKEQAIRDTYALARERLGEDPRVIISLQPFSTEVNAELTARVLDEASGRCPLYGAISSTGLETNSSGIFVNGVFYTDRILLNLLGGGIRPVFAQAQAALPIPQKRAVITQAEGNVVYRVGEDTFLQFMAKNGLAVGPSHVLESFYATYTSSPVVIREKGDGGGNRLVRNILGIDYATGAVTFSGDMHLGWEVAISVLKREDVINSSVACFEDIIRKIRANTGDDYRYSTLFSTAGGGRYLIMSGNTSVEGDFITNTPTLRSLASCGFFSMGEICPVSVDADHKADNRALQMSITLMAM